MHSQLWLSFRMRSFVLPFYYRILEVVFSNLYYNIGKNFIDAHWVNFWFWAVSDFFKVTKIKFIDLKFWLVLQIWKEYTVFIRDLNYLIGMNVNNDLEFYNFELKEWPKISPVFRSFIENRRKMLKIFGRYNITRRKKSRWARFCVFW